MGKALPIWYTPCRSCKLRSSSQAVLVESLFRWMTQHFERRLPNTSYGWHDANTAAEAGGMTLEELERCFIQVIVDDYQQAWDPLRRQRRTVLSRRGTEPERAAKPPTQQQDTTETVGEQVQTRKSPKCTSSGVVSIDLKRFLHSGKRSTHILAQPTAGATIGLPPAQAVNEVFSLLGLSLLQLCPKNN